jgi:hypothetical protein
MRSVLLLLCLAPAIVHAQSAAATAAPASAATSSGALRVERAYFAWEAGRYVEALEELKRVLSSPDASAMHDRIAELTGETWQTAEVARDARAPRWSPDGRHLSYEVGAPSARRVRIVRVTTGFPVVLDTPGASPSFAADGQGVAWLSTGTDGRAIVRWMPLGETSAERNVQDIPLDAAAATSLTLVGRAPLRLAVLAGTPGDSTATLLVRDVAATTASWQRVETAGAQPVDIVRSANGARAIVLLGKRGAFARAIPGFAAAARSDAFAELFASPAELGARVEGIAPTISQDASTIAWLATDGARTRLLARRGASAALTEVTISTTPVQGLSIAPDGARLAWSTMLREDWEIMTAPVLAGGSPSRLTREIQHDILPQFLSPTRLLATIGEARHRRSYVYDVTTGVRTRLFHNNSVRTVAPEYDWVASPDGTRVAIVAERDGDTVTPHRHLFVVDLTARVTRDALVARVDSNLTVERARRVAATRMFAPIATAVRDATAAVDVGRIYAHEKALFGFDSKHITQPGNAGAVDYLVTAYRSFGLAAQLQPFRTVAGRELDVANVVAVVPGTINPELVYVVGAHFDSRAEGPGADDNTSGTAMILESARVLATRPQAATVMFVSFTGEEAGLRGAREFARRMRDSIRVVGALNNDMMGWANDQRMDNTIRYSNPGIRDVQHAAAMQFSGLITYDAFYFKNTDANALYDVWGDIIGGIGSYPILGNPHYHMPHDVLETINHQQLAETSRTTVATIMLLASSPSRLTGLTARGAAASWNAAVERGPMRYLVRWGPPNDPMKYSATVSTPRATLTGAVSGWQVAVKAVNAKGLEGWDWARLTID